MRDEQPRFLERIRAALGPDRAPHSSWEQLMAPVDDAPLLEVMRTRRREERFLLLEQLQANAGSLHLTVHACGSPAEAARRITAIAKESRPEFGVKREIVLHDHPLLRGLELAPRLAAHSIATRLTRNAEPAVRGYTENSYIGITVADWAIAESATIVQVTRPGQPRSTSLVPSIHIAVVALTHLVATLAEAYSLIRRQPALDSLVLISGPSKTADIEGVMVHGAHGPRAMHLIVLTAEPDAGCAPDGAGVVHVRWP